MCPFHNWTYANDGALVGVPRERDFGPVDKSCMGLIELPAVERNGMLWVHPKPDGELDVAPLLGGLEDELADWNVGSFVYLGETVIEGDLNWKLANDTFGETYHFQRLHKKTLGRIFYGDALAYETSAAIIASSSRPAASIGCATCPSPSGRRTTRRTSSTICSPTSSSTFPGSSSCSSRSIRRRATPAGH